MRKVSTGTFVTSATVALALLGFGASRASAATCPVPLSGPFCIDGDDNGTHHPTSGIANQTDATDPLSSTGTKELSPKNGNDYKLFNINSTSVPVLYLTSQPDKVDLVAVSTQSQTDLATGHKWFYFAWTRATTNGSGFITIELQKNPVNTTNCNYKAVKDFTDKNDAGVKALIANCNPWAGRSEDDLLISWNQVGNTNLQLFTQSFCAVGSTRPQCQGIALPSWGKAQLAPVSAAAFCDPSGNSFCGEAAIDLTLLKGDSCLGFANTIPMTVTGNTLDYQATSDAKDTVFFDFPPIASCGTLSVTKRLVDVDGKTLVDPTPTFGYRVDRTAGAPVRFDLDVASPSTCAADPTSDHCVDGPATQRQIVRPNGSGGAALHGGETQTHSDLIASSDYRLVETAISSQLYVLVDAKCFDGSSGPGASTLLGGNVSSSALTMGVSSVGVANGSYVRIDSETLLVTGGGGTTTLTVERAQLGTAAAAHSSGATVQALTSHTVSTTVNQTTGLSVFQIVVPDGIKQTDCVITNKFVKQPSSIRTEQRARVNDTAFVTLGLPLASGEASGDITIKLYSGDNCAATSGSLLTTRVFAGNTTNSGVTAFNVTTGDSDFVSGVNSATAAGDTFFSWRASYAGDSKNLPSTDLACEVIKINIKNQ